jgi:predicted anti-sigma-YlaC factor YlaD
MHQEPSESCKEVFALLSDYLNLELPAATCQSIEAHLAGCSPCIEFVESLRKTVDLCKKYRPEDLPAPLGDKAREELMAAYQRMLAAKR